MFHLFNWIDKIGRWCRCHDASGSLGKKGHSIGTCTFERAKSIIENWNSRAETFGLTWTFTKWICISYLHHTSLAQCSMSNAKCLSRSGFMTGNTCSAMFHKLLLQIHFWLAFFFPRSFLWINYYFSFFIFHWAVFVKNFFFVIRNLCYFALTIEKKFGKYYEFHWKSTHSHTKTNESHNGLDVPLSW